MNRYRGTRPKTTDMIEKIAPRQDPPSEASDAVRQAYFLRIEELKGYATEDEIEVNLASEKDFWAFVESLHPSKRANLVLTNSGNLKAVWKNTGTGHLGIQFLGNNQGEYVIFKRRPAESETSRVVGIDSLRGIKSQMTAFGVIELVRG